MRKLTERSAPPARTGINSGPGRMLVAVYALLGLAATGRSIMQIAQTWPEQHLPYWLSAVAAVVYLVATVALARGDRASARVALATISFELFGVLAVGVWSYADKAAFVAQGSAGDTTVWSKFGQGYGYVPLILPILGLWWLRHHRVGRADDASPGSVSTLD